jgi:hypothetical protein
MSDSYIAPAINLEHPTTSESIAVTLPASAIQEADEVLIYSCANVREATRSTQAATSIPSDQYRWIYPRNCNVKLIPLVIVLLVVALVPILVGGESGGKVMTAVKLLADTLAIHVAPTNTTSGSNATAR